MIGHLLAFILATACALLAQQILQLNVVESTDLVAQFVDQFEHGERLFRRPEAGDLDGERTQMRGRLLTVPAACS